MCWRLGPPPLFDNRCRDLDLDSPIDGSSIVVLGVFIDWLEDRASLNTQVLWIDAD